MDESAPLPFVIPSVAEGSAVRPSAPPNFAFVIGVAD
jgi:hypothetical protein